MDIAEHGYGKVAVLAISGDLVEDGMRRQGVIGERVERLVGGGKTLVLLDLAGVERVDAMGLGEIAGAFRRARSRGADLKIFNPRPRVDRLLAVTRLRSVIDVWEPDVEAAGLPVFPPVSPSAVRV